MHFSLKSNEYANPDIRISYPIYFHARIIIEIHLKIKIFHINLHQTHIFLRIFILDMQQYKDID